MTKRKRTRKATAKAAAKRESLARDRRFGSLTECRCAGCGKPSPYQGNQRLWDGEPNPYYGDPEYGSASTMCCDKPVIGPRSKGYKLALAEWSRISKAIGTWKP